VPVATATAKNAAIAADSQHPEVRNGAELAMAAVLTGAL
jgi:hypothetical protein